MDRQAAERRVEAEQLLALRQQIKGLNDDKQMALDRAHQDLALKDSELERLNQRVQELDAADRAQRSELERLHEAGRAGGSKISVLEKQLATTDRKMRELDKQLRKRDEDLQRTRDLTHGVKAREQHLQDPNVVNSQSHIFQVCQGQDAWIGDGKGLIIIRVLSCPWHCSHVNCLIMVVPAGSL